MLFLESDDYEVLYGGAVGGGKLLNLATPIATPSGWVANGDLVAGDTVFSEHGKPIKVIHAFDPVEKPESYRLSFDDGSTLDACAEHKWLTFDNSELAALTRLDPDWRKKRRESRPSRATGKRSAAFTAAITARNAAKPPPTKPTPTGTVRSTAKIFATLHTNRGHTNHAIPVASALELPEADLLVDPYVLGAWLGDGTALSGGFTGVDPQIWQEFEAVGYVVTHGKRDKSHYIKGLVTQLRALGVRGNKHIPPQYLRASKAQRLALLQGLMDTDGTVTYNGSSEFTNTNKRIADGVHELIVSLGWKCRMMESRATLYGKDCGPKYDIKWTPSEHVFRLDRKREKQRIASRRTTQFRYIIDCQPIEPVPMRCIAVDNPTGLFLAGREMCVTHNSDALLIDGWCLAFDAHKNPNHRAIVFRRSYPELQELIDRAKDLFPRFIPGIKYDQTEHRFTTPAGAKYRFGYLANDNDRLKYKQAYNWIGMDELTLWATSVCYDYLRTRNRSSDATLPKYMRATTNPDGPGQKWVMERWGITPEGDGTRIVVPVEMEVPDGPGRFKKEVVDLARTFIPARLSDNPYLRGTGYAEILAQQDDPDVVEALLEGKWIGNRVRGAVYVNQMQRARNESRVGLVPFRPNLPVNTFWDLGYNDTTAIWFHQQVGGANHFIRCTENSGVGLEYYSALLQTLAVEHGYTYGKHYLPHDAAARSRKAQGKNDAELLRELLPGQKFEIVPVTPNVITGINQTRAAMASAVFDKKECADGIAALDAYRFRFDKTLEAFGTEPVHDWASNYSDAFRQFGQGYEPVRQLTEQATPQWKRELLARTKRRNPATA